MLSYFFEAPRPTKRLISIVYDCLAITLSLYLAVALRLGQTTFEITVAEISCLVITLIVSIGCFIRLGLYRAVLRFMAHQAVMSVMIGVFMSSITLAASSYFLHANTPRSVPVIYIFTALFFLGMPRAMIRHVVNLLHPQGDTKVIIYGADTTGHQLAGSLQNDSEYQPVAFVDDNKKLHGSSIRNIPVVNPSEIERIISEHGVSQVFLALGRIPRADRLRIVRFLESYPVQVQTIPPFSDIITGRARIEELRQVQIEDLLGRDPVAADYTLMATNITGKHVMVTGAGGSIGSELCREIIKLFPKTLVLFELNEFNLYKIENELNKILESQGSNIEIVPLLGSVEHQNRLEAVMKNFSIDTVYHAAAYKHVPLVEQNLVEGVRNNLFGTLRCANAAKSAKVSTFVLVSTDKAVRPTNIMGASKRLAELALQAMNEQQTETTFCMVRFGNVLGSSGSVVPKFREQIQNGGPVTVTHPEITRYFMTVKEAAQLVIQAGAMAEGGEVFVLEMGEPVKIYDMAKEMIRLSGLSITSSSNPEGDIAIEFTGLRPGEKLYEELLVGENCEGTSHPRIMKANENYLSLQEFEKLAKSIDGHCHQFNQEKLWEEVMQSPAAYKPTGKLKDLMFIKQEQKPQLKVIN